MRPGAVAALLKNKNVQIIAPIARSARNRCLHLPELAA